jgi:hypothetical protein
MGEIGDLLNLCIHLHVLWAGVTLEMLCVILVVVRDVY